MLVGRIVPIHQPLLQLSVPADLHGREALDFCSNIIKQTAPYAAAFKPNAAFFEVLGPDGWAVLKQVIDRVLEESVRLGSRIPVILDAKRGDIASTAEAYARSAFDSLGADGITLSPYLGKDSIEPFVRNPEKGAFLLCKTSNAGSLDLQDTNVLPEGAPASMPLHLHVARLASQWNERNNIGLVVGATFPQVMSSIRQIVPDMWFLSPGIDRSLCPIAMNDWDNSDQADYGLPPVRGFPADVSRNNAYGFSNDRTVQAQESERQRIALELHDGLGQLLTLVPVPKGIDRLVEVAL